MNKTSIYVVVIIVLLAGNVGLLIPKKKTQAREDKTYFVADDLQRISRFQFFSKQDTTIIEKTESGWIINDSYKADENFIGTLMSILERVETGSTLEKWEDERLAEVEIEIDHHSRYSFSVGTNPTKTRSFFIGEKGAVEVSVPGYSDNVVDVFLLNSDQWRDRLIVDASWRTIQKLTVLNEKEETVTLTFDDTFFLVNGLPPQDSSAVVDYLNQYQYFQANEMVSEGRFSNLDSLANTPPMATIEIDDIKQEAPVQLKIFPSVAPESFHLVMKEGVMMVVDAKRVKDLLVTAEDFLGEK